MTTEQMEGQDEYLKRGGAQRPQPAIPGIITTQFIDAPPGPMFEWPTPLPIGLNKVDEQSAINYANLYFVPDTAKWMIAYAAYLAGVRNA